MRADKAVPYGDVMDLMNALRAAGYLKIGLVGLDAGPRGQAGGASGTDAPPEGKAPGP